MEPKKTKIRGRERVKWVSETEAHRKQPDATIFGTRNVENKKKRKDGRKYESKRKGDPGAQSCPRKLKGVA